MLFLDDQSRHDYHKTPALLQVVCTIFESYLTESGAQLELIDVERSSGMWIAMCDVPDCSLGPFREAVRKLNESFIRHDEIPTCTIENERARLVTIRVSEPMDFAHLN